MYLPAMGEGVIEATINKWLVAEGARVEEDDPLVEVATDKVDSEVPSPAKGILTKIIAVEGSIPRVGDIIAVIEDDVPYEPQVEEKVEKEVARVRETIDELRSEQGNIIRKAGEMKSRTPSGKYLSPLVRSIASAEGVSYEELDSVTGTGMDGRITKDDLTGWLRSRRSGTPEVAAHDKPAPEPVSEISGKQVVQPASSEHGKGDSIVEMDRVRKLIAEHMIMSKRTSAHVTSFIDADVTLLINWRAGIRESFLEKEGIKLTLTPIFIDAAARALKDFPMLNSSVDGNSIILRKSINIGMATALPDGNLIVPVIRNCDEKSLTGIARAVNDLADRARKNKLKPDEITGGTFTLTNYGSYDNLAGTPIINQPQVAILGTGAVRKTPVVIESPEGDMIGIRHVIILSLSYDHRVIDGALAGKFLKRVKEILEHYEG